MRYKLLIKLCYKLVQQWPPSGNVSVQMASKSMTCLMSIVQYPFSFKFHILLCILLAWFSFDTLVVIIVSIRVSMVSYWRIIVGLSQVALAVGWGSPLHAWLASLNRIGCARCPNRRYRYGGLGVYYHCGSTAKLLHLQQCGENILIVNATKIHLSKFQYGISNGCNVTKA